MKRVLALVIAIVMLLSFTVFAEDKGPVVEPEYSNRYITVDGFRIRLEKPFIKRNDGIMIFYQDVNKISFSANYDDDINTVFAYSNDDLIAFEIGKNRVKMNTQGSVSWINVEPAFVEDDSIYVPLMVILKYADAIITYDKAGNIFVELPKEKKVTTYESGSVYEGNYSYGGLKKQGYGVFTWASGGKYEGNWFNDSINGFGKQTWSDGKYYQGYFIDGKRNGKGETYDKNGQLIEQGNYIDGYLQDENIRNVKILPEYTIYNNPRADRIPTVTYLERSNNPDGYLKETVVVLGKIVEYDISDEEALLMIDEGEHKYTLLYGSYLDSFKIGDMVLIIGQYGGLYNMVDQGYGVVELIFMDEYTIYKR